jgi:transposase
MKNQTLTLTHSEATKEKLLTLADKIPGAWIGIKIAALLLVIEGQRPCWIIDVLGLTRMSLNRWLHGVNEQGLDFLRPKPRPGRPTNLESKVQRALEEHLDKTPQDFGLNRANWDGPTVVVHLKKHFGINLKVRQAQRWMHHLGYRMKRASYSYIQAKSKDAKKFQKVLKKTSHAEG